ncbi:MAG: cupin domain-containing protein [Ectothiorhodospiraceae bacterium]|jgi:quercetin dioxygenase-like cupin family protein
MKNPLVSTLIAAGLLLLAQAHASPATPSPILPDSLSWSSPPAVPGLHAAWVIGSEDGTAAYVLRVRLEPGAEIPPHSHPDQRITTVLSGSIRVAFGRAVDAGNMVSVPAGAVYVAPAGTVHYIKAGAHGAVYQESGTGPTGTVIEQH